MPLHRRNVTGDIWRAVVVAGAMLAPSAGCGSKAPPSTLATTPATTTPATTADPAEVPTEDPQATTSDENPCGDDETNPCGDMRRPRGDDDGPRGRGFLLA